MKRTSCGLHALLIGLMLYPMTGCQNGNLFGGLHKSGSGGAASVQSDAAIALRSRDFESALTLYNRVLESDPNNAEALYGASAAAMGASGLNIGQIISQLLQQNGSGSTSSLDSFGGIIQKSRNSLSSSGTLHNPNGILYGVDLTRLKEELPTIRRRLEKILKGETNLTILPTDVDANVNAAIVLVIDATVTALDNDVLDVVNDNGDYSIEEGAAFHSICSNTAVVQRIGSDLCVAYLALNNVVVRLGLNDNKIITKAREDIRTVLDDLLNPSSTKKLDPACISTLTDIGITYGLYSSYSGWLH